MAPPERILAVDLCGSAVVFEEFERVIIAPGGFALIVSSMAGHMSAALPKEQDHALAFTPADQLLKLPSLGPEGVPNSMVAYIISKRGNHLRTQSASIGWGKRGARVNSISPGVISTSLAQHELNSPIGDMYRATIEATTAKRIASPDEVAVAANFLLGPDAGFITGSDLLIDGGMISAMLAGLLPTPKERCNFAASDAACQMPPLIKRCGSAHGAGSSILLVRPFLEVDLGQFAVSRLYLAYCGGPQLTGKLRLTSCST